MNDGQASEYHRNSCQTRSGLRPPEGWRTLGRDEWIWVLRPMRLTVAEKAVALSLASYANKKDGKSAHPGNDRLAWESCTSVITVRRALAKLQRDWLIHCYRCGDGRGHSADWGLTTHSEVEQRSVCIPFETWREQFR